MTWTTPGQVFPDYFIDAKPQHQPLAEVCGPLMAKFWGQRLMAKVTGREGWGAVLVEGPTWRLLFRNTLPLCHCHPQRPTNSNRTQSIAESARGRQPVLVPHFSSATNPSLKQIYIKKGLWATSPLSFSHLESPSLVFPMITPPAGWWAGTSLKPGDNLSPSSQVQDFIKLTVAAWRSFFFF